MKIIIIQRIYPIYRKAIFDKLNKAFGMLFFHGKNTSGIKQIQTEYSVPIKLVQLAKKETLAFLFGYGKIIKARPGIIFHEFTIGIPSLLIVRFLAFVMGSRFILWGHNINLKRGFHPFSSIADFYRYILMKTSHAVLFYTPDQVGPVKKYINNDKLFIAYNALDTNTQLATYKQISAGSREDIKKELHIDTQYNLIFISRLLPTKKPEQIIEIYELLDERIKAQTGVHIIGGGPMYDTLAAMIDKAGYANNIKLYGEINDELTLGKFLYVSDFMINPGYLGLSVNLAYAYGCPIITFENEHMEQVHSPEVYYLKHGYTGIKIYELDLKLMANALSESLLSGAYAKMRENCLTTIYQEGSIEKMFEGFAGAIAYVSRNKK